MTSATGIRYFGLALLLAACSLASGCAGLFDSSSTRVVHDVTVNFVDDCPDSVTPDPLADVERGDKVRWITGGDPAIEFWIVFDPFVGKSIRKRPGATNVTSRAVRNDRGNKAPIAEYKYTIVTDDEDGDGEPDCPPLDPRFIVSK